MSKQKKVCNALVAETKVCSKCNRSLALEFFGPDARRKDGRQARCRECYRVSDKLRRAANAATRNEASKKYYAAHRSECQERIRQYGKSSRGRERNLIACRKYRAANPERRMESARAWARRNRAQTQARYVERYHSDPAFNLTIKLRRRAWVALNRGRKSKKRGGTYLQLLGCSYDFFRQHIESLFTPGMTWDKCFNGEIHLDHIMPCSSFDLLDPAQQAECFHYTNLQPLWAKDNLMKSDRSPDEWAGISAGATP